MSSLLSTNLACGPQVAHSSYGAGAILDDLSQQLLVAHTRQLSRCSSGPRSGNAMRVTKPTSANNSPRSSLLQSRRKTLVADGFPGHFQPQRVNQPYLPTPTSELSSEPVYEQDTKPTRPLSWHPSSQYLVQQQQQPYTQQGAALYPFSPYQETDIYGNMQQLPPTPTVYSGYTTPSSAFSPLSLPYTALESQQYYSPTHRTNLGHQDQAIQQAMAYRPNPEFADTTPEVPYYASHSGALDQQQGSYPFPSSMAVGGGESMDWRSLDVQGTAGSGSDRCTAPPTPEDFIHSHQQQPVTKVVDNDEDSISYQPLEEEESDGEILYGMGLYDTPDSCKSLNGSVLDLHRSTIFSLLGNTAAYPEPTGKGLKLEDAWEPPASTDGDDEEEDEDEGEDGEDAEGDE